MKFFLSSTLAFILASPALASDPGEAIRHRQEQANLRHRHLEATFPTCDHTIKKQIQLTKIMSNYYVDGRVGYNMEVHVMLNGQKYWPMSPHDCRGLNDWTEDDGFYFCDIPDKQDTKIAHLTPTIVRSGHQYFTVSMIEEDWGGDDFYNGDALASKDWCVPTTEEYEMVVYYSGNSGKRTETCFSLSAGAYLEAGFGVGASVGINAELKACDVFSEPDEYIAFFFKVTRENSM